MGIESTIELDRQEAINLCAKRMAETLVNLNSMCNEKIEDLLYATRDSIFNNYLITS